MKIFVSIASNKTKTNDLKEGVDALKRIGHNVNVSDRFSDKNDKLIKDCDLLIAEISELNYKQGFEIKRKLNKIIRSCHAGQPVMKIINTGSLVRQLLFYDNRIFAEREFYYLQIF